MFQGRNKKSDLQVQIYLFRSSNGIKTNGFFGVAAARATLTDVICPQKKHKVIHLCMSFRTSLNYS